MIEKQLICDVCGRPVEDTVCEMTDELDVHIQMCMKCYDGIKEANLISITDKIEIKPVNDVLSEESNNESN